jgi:uncharacterized tellurite resistance protein B-like protein
MSAADLTTLAFELPPAKRLELARRLVESVIAPATLDGALDRGIRRIEDVLTGRVKPMTEAEFRAALR